MVVEGAGEDTVGQRHKCTEEIGGLRIKPGNIFSENRMETRPRKISVQKTKWKTNNMQHHIKQKRSWGRKIETNCYVSDTVLVTYQK